MLRLQRSTRTPSTLLAVSVSIAVIILLAAESHGADFFLEASTSRGHPRTEERSNARNGLAVHLQAGDSIQLTFCVRQTTVMQVLSVIYSNDGLNETLAVVVDDNFFLGTFSSHNRSDWGRLWNMFFPSPIIPSSIVVLPRGWHSLRIGVLPPSDGVELDSVHVWFSDEGLTKSIVDCLLVCSSRMPAAPALPASVRLWQNASAEQGSYRTKCAEEDNVKVPLYLGGVSEYTLTATMPTYVSFDNRRHPNTTGCAFLSPVLFSFTHLPLPLPLPRHRAPPTLSRFVPGASLFLYRSPGSRNQIMRLEFKLKGRSQGYVDAEMGSILTVNIQKSAAEILIKTDYLGRSASLTPMKNTVIPANSSEPLVQQFADYTWIENGTNVLMLQFESSLPLHVTGVKMERRPMRGEKVHTVYRSPKVVVEAIEVDFWWRRPETMTLKNGETGESWSPVDYFRISLHVPWNGGFAQVFVMYQDGNVRLAPLPPRGVDWIPFGSSVIVGHSDPADLRPSAPVTTVTFYPSTLAMHVQHLNGEAVKLKLSSTHKETQMVVKDILTSGRGDWGLPFATLRSMYLEDGNSDCDSVLVDGKSYRSIMDPWGSLRGKSFFFFRRCESTHLTLSPDIRIDVTKTSYVTGERSGVGGGGGKVTPNNDWWWNM
ncbi:hypothetical protein ACOMHN_021652 [Nucella lapillus]